jgi:hypothetical protein
MAPVHQQVEARIVAAESHLIANWQGWSAKLSRLIELQNATKFRTLADVRDFILEQPEHVHERSFWQLAAKLLINAAEEGGDIEAATQQIELALFFEGHFVLR